MKRFLMFAAALLTLEGCSQSELSDVIDEPSSERRTVEVTVKGSADTRISIDSTNEDEWEFKWESGDALTGWDFYSSQQLNKFEMVELKENADFATFKGDIITSHLRLIYPYKENATLKNNNYVIDLAQQSVDMSGDAKNNYADQNLYMVSEEIFFTTADTEISRYPTMSHLLPLIMIEVKGTNITEDLVVDYITISGLSNYAELTFLEGELTNEAAGEITIDVSNCPKLVNDEVLAIPFSAIPFTFNPSSAAITIKATFTNGETIQINKPAPNYSSYPFVAGTHNYLTADFDAADLVSPFKGEGTSTAPYQISTADDLRNLSKFVNAGTNYSDKHFKLMNNINLGGSANEFTAIGSNSPFKGTFDGNGKEILGLYINQGSKNKQALFGYIHSATIKNLIVSGQVTAKDFVGGIVGSSEDSTITYCTNNANVTGGNGANYGGVGGVVGYSNNSTTTNSYNNGKVSAGTETFIGGVIGYNDLSFTVNCGNNKSATVSSGGSSQIGSACIGGVVGENYGSTVVNCYNKASVTINGNNAYIGGVVGYNTYLAEVIVGFNSGELSGNGNDNVIGGIAGYNYGCLVKFSFYNNSYSVVGYGSSTSSTDCRDLSDESLKTCTSTINNFAAIYNEEYNTPDACAWVSNANDYPSLDFDAEPIRW